jgi:hypothetical protein
LELWRGEAYNKFFDFLDEKGGFYYEVGSWILSFVSRFMYVHSAGETPPCTASVLLYLPRKSKSISSMTSAIATSLSNIVLKAMHTKGASVGVILIRILVEIFYHPPQLMR